MADPPVGDLAVVEDQALVRALMVERLAVQYGGRTRVRGYASVAELLLAGDPADLVLLDLQLEGASLEGPAAVRACVGAGMAVLVLSGLHTAEALDGALAAGAGGFMTKDVTDVAQIAAGIERVLTGERFVDPLLRERIDSAARRMLTARQREVLRLEALGRTVTQIAGELGLKERGVRDHLEAIVKVHPDCAKQADRVRLAARLGLVTSWETYRSAADGPGERGSGPRDVVDGRSRR
jgi:DNA-binding NarL/FixJ family response regulator